MLDIELRSSVMTLLPCRSCQLRRAMDISRERRKSSPLMLSWAGLLGHGELIQVGSAAEKQLCPGAAPVHHTAGQKGMICSRKGGEKEESLQVVWHNSRLRAQWKCISHYP